MAFLSLSASKNPQDKALCEFIHNVFGFRPKNISLYNVAFTHKSVAIETIGNYQISNERMEYLGDAVLSLVVGDFLFRTYPTQAEGFLTEMRSRIVSRVSLNKLAEKLGFDNYIRHSSDTGYSARSIGGNAFEAFIGAVYLDHGFDFTKHVIIDRIIRIHIDLEQIEQTDINFKKKLIEWAQKRHDSISFKLLEDVGKGSKKRYHVQVIINEKKYGDAFDRSIRGAEQLAAEKTCNVLFGKD